MRPASDPLAVGATFLAIAVLACLAPVQSDTWWHLRAGQDLWQTGKVSLTDTYSYTAAGRPWPNHEWLTQLLFAGLFRLGGLPLLQAATAGALTLALVFVWRMRTGSFEVALLILAVGLIPSVVVWAVRPQAYSLALFAATCALIRRDRWVWLPVVMAVWTNLHGAVALGIVAVWAAALATTGRAGRIAWRETTVALACLAATGLSPLGFSLWTEIGASIGRSRENLLIEWRPPGLAAAMLPFWGLAVAFAALATRRARALDPAEWRLVAIATATLPLALSAVRNVPVFLIAAMPALTALIDVSRRVHAAPHTRRQGRGDRPTMNLILLAMATVACAAIVATNWLAPRAASGWRPMSEAARDAIRACGQPIYNTFLEGGPLIWFVPEVKVFVDNRQDPYPAELMSAARRAEGTGDLSALTAAYGFQCAIVPPGSRLDVGLRRDPAWTIRFADAQWTVFTARDRPAARE